MLSKPQFGDLTKPAGNSRSAVRARCSEERGRVSADVRRADVSKGTVKRCDLLATHNRGGTSDTDMDDQQQHGSTADLDVYNGHGRQHTVETCTE